MFIHSNGGSRKDFNFKIQRNMYSGVYMPLHVNFFLVSISFKRHDNQVFNLHTDMTIF